MKLVVFDVNEAFFSIPEKMAYIYLFLNKAKYIVKNDIVIMSMTFPVVAVN